MLFPPQGFGQISLGLKRESRETRTWTPDKTFEGDGFENRYPFTPHSVPISMESTKGDPQPLSCPALRGEDERTGRGEMALT